jgi:hypothetical protein
MLTLDDIDLIEGNTTCTTVQYYQAIQRAINQGLWSMQGSYGRTMMDAIKSGHCLLGVSDCTDYWGNHVPSRDQVVEGTVGSMQFVIDNMGADWADQMGSV